MVVKEFVLPLIFCGAILELVSRVGKGVCLQPGGIIAAGRFDSIGVFQRFLGVMAVQGAGRSRMG